MEEGLRREEGNDSWRVLEFYSGIGGMRYSLMKSGVNAEVVEAFDINDVANDVYQHNFHHRPYQGNIQSLSAAELDRYEAHAWLLSPPCQPYTRQGLQKGSEDARASSFLTILELIPFASNPPRLLFVENVVGFETSDTHQKMTEILAKADFVLQEFILSPLQCGVPYSRPRYFCLAKRKPSSFKYPSYNNQLLLTPVLLFGDNGTSINGKNQCGEGLHDLEQSCEPIRSFLEFKDSRIQVKAESSPLYTSHILAGTSETDVSKDNEIGSDGVPLGSYDVPLSLIERWGSAMDIVYPDSKRCCCFTKSYYRYVKGTGSLLASVQGQNEDKASVMKEQQLRYFTPREVANLHSFPSEFEFPKCISLRQRYALLGNSLSVAVVGPLLRYLFSEPAR